MDDVNWDKFSVNLLKKKILSLGMETSGKKATLVARLKTYMLDNGSSEIIEELEEEHATNMQSSSKKDVEPEPEIMEVTSDEKKTKAEMIKEDDQRRLEQMEKEDGVGEEEQAKLLADIMSSDEEELTMEQTDDVGRAITVAIPKPNFYRMMLDKRDEQKVKTVVVAPVTREDLVNSLFNPYFGEADKFFIRFSSLTSEHGSERKEGHIEFRFHNYEQAVGMAEQLKMIKSGLVVKQLTPEESCHPEKLEQEMLKATGWDDPPKEDLGLRTLVVLGLPAGASDGEIKDLFPEARSVLVPRDKARRLKGYAYLEYATMLAAEEEFEKMKNADMRIQESKLRLRMVGGAAHLLPGGTPAEEMLEASKKKKKNKSKSKKKELTDDDLMEHPTREKFEETLKELNKKIRDDEHRLSSSQMATLKARLRTVQQKLDWDRMRKIELGLWTDKKGRTVRTVDPEKQQRPFGEPPDKRGRYPPRAAENPMEALNLIMGLTQALTTPGGGGGRDYMDDEFENSSGGRGYERAPPRRYDDYSSRYGERDFDRRAPRREYPRF